MRLFVRSLPILLLSTTTLFATAQTVFPPAGTDFIRHNLRVAVDVGDNGSTDEILVFRGDMVVDRGNPYTTTEGFRRIDFVVRQWTAIAPSTTFGTSIFYVLSPSATQIPSRITAQQMGSDFPAHFKFNVIFDAHLGSTSSPPVVQGHMGMPEGGGFASVPPDSSSPLITQFESNQIVLTHPTLGQIRFTPIDCHDQESRTVAAIPALSTTGAVLLAVLLALVVIVILRRRGRAIPAPA